MASKFASSSTTLASVARGSVSVLMCVNYAWASTPCMPARRCARTGQALRRLGLARSDSGPTRTISARLWSMARLLQRPFGSATVAQAVQFRRPTKASCVLFMMAVVYARRGDGRFRPGVSLSQMALPESGNVCGVRSLIGSSWRTRRRPLLVRRPYFGSSLRADVLRRLLMSGI